jgi:hypothetical protein
MKFLLWATEGMSGADLEILVEAGKRFFVLHGQKEIEADGKLHRLLKSDRGPFIIEALRRQAVLNTRMFADDRAKLLMGPMETLDSLLEQIGLKQAEIGVILGMSQSAISRRRKREATDFEEES